MTTSYIFWNIFLGALGLVYMSYAKSQKKIIPALGGLVLLAVPYFTSTEWIFLATLVTVVAISYKFITAPTYNLKFDAGDFVHNQGRFLQD